MPLRAADPLRRAWRSGVRWLAGHHLLGVPDGLARLARSYLRHYAAAVDPYDIDTNGERALIERAVDSQSTVFDVGANIGDWTELAAGRGATVHAFEISPDTAQTLSARFADHPDVTTHAVGLADHDGEMRLRHYPDVPELSTTVLDFPHPHPFEELVVPVVRGARLARELGVDHIDLLKIDVEGAEPRVLEGFRPMLEDAAIDIVQFEYGLVNALERFLVGDFYGLLEPLGYRLGPLTPDGVRFCDYAVGLERFEHVNWVAVPRDRHDLIDRLGASGGEP